jgi:hypothetical protein
LRRSLIIRRRCVRLPETQASYGFLATHTNTGAKLRVGRAECLPFQEGETEVVLTSAMMLDWSLRLRMVRPPGTAPTWPTPRRSRRPPCPGIIDNRHLTAVADEPGLTLARDGALVRLRCQGETMTLTRTTLLAALDRAQSKLRAQPALVREAAATGRWLFQTLRAQVSSSGPRPAWSERGARGSAWADRVRRRCCCTPPATS